MSGHGHAISMTARRGRPLKGRAEVPGDKSISHRSLILGALAVGRTEVTGLLEGQDVLDTAAAMRAFGATVTQGAPGHWTVDGVGVGGFAEPIAKELPLEYAVEMNNLIHLEMKGSIG